jgi:hypothetical protein
MMTGGRRSATGSGRPCRSTWRRHRSCASLWARVCRRIPHGMPGCRSCEGTPSSSAMTWRMAASSRALREPSWRPCSLARNKNVCRQALSSHGSVLCTRTWIVSINSVTLNLLLLPALKSFHSCVQGYTHSFSQPLAPHGTVSTGDCLAEFHFPLADSLPPSPLASLVASVRGGGPAPRRRVVV